VSATILQAQSTEKPSVNPLADVVPTGEAAELVINNRPITTFRAQVDLRGPRDRAAAGKKRIEDLIASRTAAEITTVSVRHGYLISANDQVLFYITQSDLDPASDQTVLDSANSAARNVRLVLSEAAEQHNKKRLLRAAGLLLLATLLFITWLVGIASLARSAVGRVPAAWAKRLNSVSFAGFTFIEAEQIIQIAHWVVRAAALVLVLIGAFIWLTFSLKLFPYTRPWGESLGAFLLNTFQTLGWQVLRAIPRLFVVLIILLAARFLARLANSFFRGVETGQISPPGFHPNTAPATRRLLVIGIWLSAAICAYPYIPGSETEAFKAAGVLLGLVVTLGSSGLVGQGMSGLVLMYSRALKPGDYVKIGENEGAVSSLGIFSTKIHTIKREEITIPNSVVLNTSTTNFTRLAPPQGEAIYTTVTIGYSTPWRQVHAMLLMAADRTPGLQPQPEPYVEQRSPSDFYVEYPLTAFLKDPKIRRQTLSALHANIQDAFNEYGVQIMSPHYEMDPKDLVVVPKDQWFSAPAPKDFQTNGDRSEVISAASSSGEGKVSSTSGSTGATS
jgi:small-conductance mechanosensitive channel